MDPEGMPNSDMEPIKSLDDELAAAGLDFLFWSKVLKDKLGVTEKKQLDYLDEEDFQSLKEHIRYRWEEKALQILFNILVPSNSEDQTKTEVKPTATTEQEDVLASFNACEDHMTKNKVKAKELEAKLKTFHEESKETYLKSERTLKDSVEGLMKSSFTGSESKCSPAMSNSDEEILKTSSGGLALQGIFKTNNVEDLLKDRQQLIQVDICKLAGPRHHSHYRKYEFSCYKSHRAFLESVEKLGYSYSIEHNLDLPAIQAKYGMQNASISTKNASSEDHSEKAYVAVTLCHYIPLASTFIDQLTLSDSAKKELTEINELLHTINGNENNPKLLEHAEKFFQKFGSHVPQGPIHFGGTFWWEAYAQGFSEQNQKKVKTTVSNALEMNCSVPSKMFLGSHHLSISKGKGDSHNTFSDELNTVVQICINKFGGPSATDDHTLWKSNLAESNKTWAVIDRGSILTPVWHIISTQHKEEFQDPFGLCTFLMRAYEKITHQRAECTDDVTVSKTLYEAKEMMRSVHKWCVPDAENHLRDLLTIKSQIKKCTNSFKQWINICLSNEALQKFLTDIMQNDDNTVRFMASLVMETHCHEVKRFPNREQILRWIRGKPEFNQNKNDMMFCSIHQFSDVQKVLQKAFEDFQQIPKEDKNNTHNITCEVTNAIKSWIDTMKGSDHIDLVFLVQSLAKLVGYRDYTFDAILGPQEIDFLKNELSDAHRKYTDVRKESPLKAQAFSLLTALTATYEDRIISIKEKQKSLDAFKQAMKTDITPDLRKAISAFLCHLNWEDFEQTLRMMIAEPFKLEDSSLSMRNESVSENKEAADNSETQHGTESATTEDFSQHNIGLVSPCAEMFKKLDLLKYYPAKISKADVNNININVSMCNNQVCKENELWFHFIYKLLTLDVNVRFLCIEPGLQVSHKSQSNTVESFIDFQDESAVSDVEQDTHIHPMDICMAVFYCSNDFVRQIVFTQLYKCHFALPLLVPKLCSQEIELPVWPLQLSALTWQSTDQSEVTGSILDKYFPVVSFMRLGNSRISKSKIMNDIINKNGHPTFFSRHCEGSTTKRLLLDGVADISWYLPEGKRSDIFKNCVAFINLHGDACNLPQQVQFLRGLSSVVILLLPENLTSASVKTALDGFLKCETPFIALFSGIETINKSNLYRIAAKNRNEADLTKEIIFKCNQCLSKEKRNQKLKHHFDQAKQQGFIVGTETEKRGKEAAEMLMNILYGKKSNKMALKDEHLPLQGDPWREWCCKDKQFHCLQCKKNMSIEQHRAEITQQKQKIREKQRENASPNIFMKEFLQYVVKAEEKERLYFFNWLIKCLDDALTSNLVDLNKQYNTAWLKYRESLGDEKINNQMNICKISDRIKQATIRIQHVFREISQLYESHHFFSKTIHGIEVDQLPEIAVDWMLSGHPLELMVGDTNYLPIQWVSAVLKKLIDKTGDKRVLVLSVVGLQSSGKSTLLNTMFGLNFAVSSGPCTRGAFMHLLSVKEQTRNLFDYILVMDTEGLRSTETNPETVVKNDNELATLIIGISDITLINVMGENLCEIQNILQVCFQALLRMKHVNIRPNCIFVHQNVSDTAAKVNNQGGRIQLIEKLDEISKAAAEEENQEVSGFNDIINFDVNRDVFYFKSLLEGDPPMAPPNPSYSQNVQELKERVLSISEWQPNCKPLILSDLSQRVKDIWDALLNENFVFNFRNSLDMKVYSDLEKKYQSWSWQLRKKALETQRTLTCRVKSNELSLISESELKLIFTDTHNTIKTGVDQYFKTQKHADILSQWRVLIDTRLVSLMEELTNETYAKGRKEITQRKLRLELDGKMRQYDKDLFQKSMAAASELRNQTPNEDLIQSEFNKLWIQWTTDFSSMNPKETETDVKVMVENALLSRFDKHKNIFCNISEKDFQFKHTDHVKFSFEKFLKSNQQNDLGNEISKWILEDTNRKIDQKAANETEVTENFIHGILEEIDEMIQKHQSSCGFRFTDVYKASISAYICKKVTRKLRKINEDFKSANDPIKQLMNKRQTYFELYKRYCQGAELVKTFVSVLTDKLKEAMQCALYDMYSIDIADCLRSHHPALKCNTSNLELHIMKQLAENENFKDYTMYIHDPKSFYREFLRECVVAYIDDEVKVVEALKSNWSRLTALVLVESSSASEHMKETQGNASMWLDRFCKGLFESQIPLSRQDLRTIENMHIESAQILKESVACSLKKMSMEDPKSLLPSQPLIFKLKEKPVDILFEQLSGCWEQCPFCKAVCTNTISNHTVNHTAEWHRSQAIGGLFHDHWSLRPLQYLRDDAGKPFVIDMCSTSVISDNKFKAQDKWIPFKNYQSAGHPYNTWKITADNNDRLYWKWFICAFKKQLEEQYKFKFEGLGKIPVAWQSISKDQVLNEMDCMINEMNRIK